MNGFQDYLGAGWAKLRRKPHPAPTLEQQMAIDTTNLIAATAALKATADALAAQTANTEAAAQTAIDTATSTLTAANNELTPLIVAPAT